jgi:hypothetical protein
VSCDEAPNVPWKALRRRQPHYAAMNATVVPNPIPPDAAANPGVSDELIQESATTQVGDGHQREIAGDRLDLRSLPHQRVVRAKCTAYMS